MIDQAIDELLNEYGYTFAETHNTGLLYDRPNAPAILIDTTIYNLLADQYPYVEYTSTQNRLMHTYSGLYRFQFEDLATLIENLAVFVGEKELNLELKIFGANRSDYHIDPTPPEYQFSEKFEQVYGTGKIHALEAEAEYVDRKGHKRYIDYVLHRKTTPIAVELNGERYHHPLVIKPKQYVSQLFKQNSLVADGYLVFRWSSRGMLDQYKFFDQIKDYFGNEDDFLSNPLYRSERQVDFALYEHQEEAVEKLQQKKLAGEKVCLVVLPTGTGKTEVFIEDFRKTVESDNAATALAIVPTLQLKTQLIERVKSRLPQIKVGDDLKDPTLQLLVQTSATMLRHYLNYDATFFDYIIVDEAHRAAAHGLRKVLEHFNPHFLLGLTATDQRLDQQKLEDIFGRYEVELTLQDAIAKGLLPQIRAYRLQSNIDLSNVRFNGKDYVQSDLQKTVIVPSRDQLIADLLNKYFCDGEVAQLNKQGVVFCVNVKHAKRMAKLLNQNNISASAVHAKDRKGIELYQAGKVQFICACDLLNEGWDSPQTSVVVMARPTMSKVVYMQQLGRGTRKYKNKEALYVIDVVDSYSAALQIQPWSFHGLLGLGTYQPFADCIDQEHGTLNEELIYLDGLYESERRIEPINIFNFEKEFAHLLNEEQLARELYVSTGTIKAWLKKGDISPDKTLPFGKKLLHYFAPEQLQKIRSEKNIKLRTELSRKDDYFEFIEKGDYTFSYKMPFMLIMLTQCNEQGEIELEILAKQYRKFYQNIFKMHSLADKKNCIYNNEEAINDLNVVKRNIIESPFEKFERKRFVYQCKDLNIVSFDTVLWNHLAADDISLAVDHIKSDLTNYYQKHLSIELSNNEVDCLLGDTVNNEPAIINTVENIKQFPFYPNLKIACGHFKTGDHSEAQQMDVPTGYEHLDPTTHFLALASGNSMNGGKNPILDGDLLLLQFVDFENQFSLEDETIVIEHHEVTGDEQYLLRQCKQTTEGKKLLVARNPDYDPTIADEDMRVLARLVAII